MRYDNTRSRVLAEAMDLINGDRQEAYGPPSENFQRIAAGWSVILGNDISPDQVALCMAWLKIARLANGKHGANGKHVDSYIDGAAYMALAAELAEK